jgi:hypothetical protein
MLRRALRAAACAIAVSAFVWLLSTVDLGAVLGTLRTIGPLASLAFVPLGIQIALEAVSWRLLLGRLGHRIGLGLAWRVNLEAEAVRLSFPGGPPLAEAMRPVLFARLRSVALADAASALVVRKLCHMSTQGTFLGMGALLGSALFEHWARGLGPAGRALPLVTAAVALGLMAAGACIGLVLSHGSLASRAERFLARLTGGRWAPALRARRASFIALDSRLRMLLAESPVTLSWNLVTGLGGWLLEAAETLLLLHLVGSPIGVGEALGVEALMSMIRIIAFAVPGGLGIQDLTYYVLLQGSVSDAAAVSLVLLKRARDVFWVATGYGLPLLLDRLASRRSSCPSLPSPRRGEGQGGGNRGSRTSF